MGSTEPHIPLHIQNPHHQHNSLTCITRWCCISHTTQNPLPNTVGYQHSHLHPLAVLARHDQQLRAPHRRAVAVVERDVVVGVIHTKGVGKLRAALQAPALGVALERSSLLALFLSTVWGSRMVSV